MPRAEFPKLKGVPLMRGVVFEGLQGDLPFCETAAQLSVSCDLGLEEEEQKDEHTRRL